MPSSTVSNFVASCRSFSDGDASATDIAHLRQVTEQEMPEHYRMPFPERELVRAPDEKQKARHLRGLWHELAQHLTDLRYLSEADFIAYHQHKHDILDKPSLLLPLVDAVSRYVAEEEDWPELAAMLPAGTQVDHYWVSKHLGAITDRIGLYTSWDGGLPLKQGFRAGGAGCHGRSLAYRARTLSSDEFRFSGEDDVFAATDSPTLAKLFREGLGLETTFSAEGAISLEHWAQLTDVDLLIASYRQHTKNREESAVLYQLRNIDEAPAAPDELIFATRDKPKLEPTLYDQPTANKMLRQARRQKNARPEGLDVRLLQIKLWQASYYRGKIDGRWGKISHQALITLLNDEADRLAEDAGKLRRAGQRNKALKQSRRVRTYLMPANREEKVYVVNFRGIIRHFDWGVSRDDPAALTNLYTNDDALKDIHRQAGISVDKFDEKILSEDGISTLYPDNVSHPERRVYYPRVPLLARIRLGFKKIFRWLKSKLNKVREKIAELLGPVFDFVKTLLRPIRSAIQRFYSGFKYLANFIFGKPLITEVAPATAEAPARLFATKFELDFDSVNFAPDTFLEGEALQHSSHIKRMQQNMAYFIDSVIWIIKAIGKLSQPGGWVWLGWQIVRAVVPISKVVV
ncbi:peptidoglycan-binding domain-containing protein [Neolewinella agarilytica]|uniref:peptidoglycan-binding domain-containing protein n=1 Tax=Neolewinella agarilytica TaxID=478744 RepID=UPI002352E9BC|nr:peptidoglycan-binding domain-containing protein [Neolewinella agarilytica]